MSGYWLKCPKCGSTKGLGSKCYLVRMDGKVPLPHSPEPVRQVLINECHACGYEEDTEATK